LARYSYKIKSRMTWPYLPAPSTRAGRCLMLWKCQLIRSWL